MAVAREALQILRPLLSSFKCHDTDLQKLQTKQSCTKTFQPYGRGNPSDHNSGTLFCSTYYEGNAVTLSWLLLSYPSKAGAGNAEMEEEREDLPGGFIGQKMLAWKRMRSMFK